MVDYIKQKNKYYKITNNKKKIEISKDKYLSCISKKFKNIILPEPKVKNNIIINIAFPSINRPEMIESNLKSLIKYLKGVDFEKSNIFMNMDPVPKIYDINKSEQIVKKYIPNLKINYSKKPSYPNAFIWTLKQCCVNKVNSNLLLFLPDDWEFINYININDVFKKLEQNPDIQAISLNNDWEHGFTFDNTINKHNENEKSAFRGTPGFFKIDFLSKYIDDLEPIPCPIEKSLNGIFIKKNNVDKKKIKLSMWLSNEQLYYCKDTGCKWRDSLNIPGDMVHKSGQYKMCSICSNLKFNYKCMNKCNGNNCEFNNYICSEKCFKIHLEYFHKDTIDDYYLKKIY